MLFTSLVFGQTKIFEFNGTKSSLLDQVSKTAGVYTAGSGRGFIATEKGSALEFDGANSKLDTNVPYTDQPLTGDITIVVWAKANSYGEGSGGRGRIVGNGKIEFAVFGTTSGFLISSDGTTRGAGGSFALHKWQQLILEREADGTVNLYNNGVLTVSDFASCTPDTGTSDILIGNDAGNGRTWDGSIARVQIWNGIFTAGQIASSYTEFQKARNLYVRGRNFKNTGASTGYDSLYIVEDFRYLDASGVTVQPIGWLMGTATVKGGEDADKKYLEWTGNGDIDLLYSQDTAVNITMDYYNGSAWTALNDTLSSLTSDSSWISVASGYLNFNLVTGQRIANIIIKQGVE